MAKVDSFTWKQGIIKDEVGLFCEPTKYPAKVEVPNLKLTISMVDVKRWQNWHRTFVIEGQNREEDEFNGRLEFLAPDLEEVLGSVDLLGVGILSLEDFGQAANKEDAGHFTVELYCEQMKFYHQEYNE